MTSFHLSQGLAPSVANELTSRSLRKTLRYGRISEWRWRLHCAVTWQVWRVLYDLAEEEGEHVRLNRKREEPPSNMHDGRAAAAPLVLGLNCATMFSYRFFEGKHLHLLELESLISLLRRVTREGCRHGGSWIRAWFWEPSRKDGSRKINFLLRRLGFWCLAYDIALELVWVPTWANLADAPHETSRLNVVMHHCRRFRLHRPRFSHQPMPSRSWICSVSYCRLRPIQRENMCASLHPPVPSVVRK